MVRTDGGSPRRLLPPRSFRDIPIRAASLPALTLSAFCHTRDSPHVLGPAQTELQTRKLNPIPSRETREHRRGRFPKSPSHQESWSFLRKLLPQAQSWDPTAGYSRLISEQAGQQHSGQCPLHSSLPLTPAAYAPDHKDADERRSVSPQRGSCPPGSVRLPAWH